MTHDLTALFVDAFAHRASWQAELIAEKLRAHGGLRLDWDNLSGEEWMRLLDGAEVVCLIWCIGPVAFAVPNCPHSVIDVLRRLGASVLVVKDLDAKDYCLRPQEISNWSIGRWSSNIPTCGFSINDLWWTTI